MYPSQTRPRLHIRLGLAEGCQTSPEFIRCSNLVPLCDCNASHFRKNVSLQHLRKIPIFQNLGVFFWQKGPPFGGRGYDSPEYLTVIDPFLYRKAHMIYAQRSDRRRKILLFRSYWELSFEGLLDPKEPYLWLEPARTQSPRLQPMSIRAGSSR